MTQIQLKKTSSRFQLFHELMLTKVQHILLISTSYEAWIMEEDARISEQIVTEYRGLNLSRPPRLTWASSLEEALALVAGTAFDLVITFAITLDDRSLALGQALKQARPAIPLVLLTHHETPAESRQHWQHDNNPFDRVLYWTGQADLLLALVKNIEDQANAVPDTRTAGVRIILFVEDSCYYLSLLLPILYKELVKETQSVIEESLNEEHRLLAMRARPKILLAQSYEQAMQLYEQFKPYVLGVISDMRYYSGNQLDGEAGRRLLSHIKADRFDIPLLLTSSEPDNAAIAQQIPAMFADKNAPSLPEKIRTFLVQHLGFGDFVFRMPDGHAFDKAANLYQLEQKLAAIPVESFIYHSQRNDFSRWFYTLAEVELASQVRPIRAVSFDSVEKHRRQLLAIIREQRLRRQRDVIVNFSAERYNPDIAFAKTGHGSLGGKARGLAFFLALIHRNSQLFADFSGRIEVLVPRTLTITTDSFDDFIALNELEYLAEEELSDQEIAARFLEGQLPGPLEAQLNGYLQQVHYPLAVRSSSILEDAQFKSYAGLYHTCMLPNNSPSLTRRLEQLATAIKTVYASTYFQAPKAFTRRVGNRIGQEKMAIILQEVIGSRHGDSYYPAISGVAQSLNYYPFGQTRSSDGAVSIALGLGKTVMEGERILRFSPRYPQMLPQQATLADILRNSQQYFYALALSGAAPATATSDASCLVRRELAAAIEEPSVARLCSSYDAAEQRLRDDFRPGAIPVLTFASILKHQEYPLPPLIEQLLSLGEKGMGCPVEVEFAFDYPQTGQIARLAVLQVRPMSAREEMLEVTISDADQAAAFCYSQQALGNTDSSLCHDLVFVRPETFQAGQTLAIARELAAINKKLVAKGKKYILMGPGRWGSADRWLGIPVGWADISGVAAIVETVHPEIHAEPSQGSHFFHNITSLGINYLNVGQLPGDHLHWEYLHHLPVIEEGSFVCHIQRQEPFRLQVDGRSHRGLIR